jgi:hypothetical protein
MDKWKKNVEAKLGKPKDETALVPVTSVLPAIKADDGLVPIESKPAVVVNEPTEVVVPSEVIVPKTKSGKFFDQMDDTNGVKDTTQSTATTEESVVRAPDEPQRVFSQGLIAKAILGVTFTAIVVDGILYNYNAGINAGIALVLITAVIQYLLYAEYHKPTLK